MRKLLLPVLPCSRRRGREHRRPPAAPYRDLRSGGGGGACQRAAEGVGVGIVYSTRCVFIVYAYASLSSVVCE